MLTNEVLAAAKAGDSNAIQTVLDAASPVVLAKVRSKSGEHYEDVFQDALIDILKDLHACSAVDASGFFAWALRIAGNSVCNHFRKVRTAKRGKGLEHADIDSCEMLCAGKISPPDEIAIANEALEEVWQLAKSISDSTYTAIWMRANGYTVADITVELGKSDLAVRGILKRFGEKARERGLVCC